MKSVARSTTPFLTATGRSLFSAPSGKTACCKDRSFVSASKMKRFLSPCKTVQLFSPAVVPDYACHAPHSADVMMAMIMGMQVPALPDRCQYLGIAFQVTNIARSAVPGAVLLTDRPRPAARGMAAWDHRTRVPAPCEAIQGGHSPERRGCMALPTAPRAAGFGRAPFPFDTRSGQPATAGADLRKGASLRLPGC